VYVGAAHWTAGARGGLFRRPATGGPWEQLTKGLPDDIHVHAITVDPASADVVCVATHHGPYRSIDRRDGWERPGSSQGLQAWAIRVHPSRPRVIYVGTSPVGVYKSDDGGEHWRKLEKAVLPERVKMPFACRVMRLAVDPARPDEIHAALEVGGVMRSFD